MTFKKLYGSIAKKKPFPQPPNSPPLPLPKKGFVKKVPSNKATFRVSRPNSSNTEKSRKSGQLRSLL